MAGGSAAALAPTPSGGSVTGVRSVPFGLPSLVNSCNDRNTGLAGSLCREELARRIKHAWLERLAFGPCRQVDHWVQIWLGVFPVHWRDLVDPALLIGQIEAIRAQLGGTYGDLLTAMVLNPALQISLNGPANHRGKPNENLARELLELFALGEGSYGENDVSEAARALTGYRLEGQALVLDSRRHDDRPKTILGRTERFDGPSLVAWLCAQPATARHIAGRWWRRTIGPLPASARLAALADAWRAQELSLPRLVSTLATTPEARNARRQGSRLEDPITVVARSLALLGSRHRDAFAIAGVQLGRMGQAPFEPPSVKGWPLDAEWLNLRWLQARRRGLAALVADEEVWASRALPAQLMPSLTPIPPLSLPLPAPGTRANLALLFNDPIWQLA